MLYGAMDLSRFNDAQGETPAAASHRRLVN
jgi:hypothetical protein